MMFLINREQIQMHRKIWLVLIISLVLLSTCEKRQVPLLKIEHHYVPVEAFFQIIPARDLPLYSHDQLQSLVNDFACDQLMLYDAYRQNYHKKPDVEQAVHAFRQNYLLEYYQKRFIVDSLITEKDLVRRYRSFSKDYQAYHPYRDVRPTLYKEALSAKRTLIAEKVVELYNNVKTRSMLHIIKPTFDNFVALYNDNYQRLNKNNSGEISPIEVLASFTFDSVLAQIKGKSYDQSWLMQVIKERQINVPTGMLNVATFKNIFENLILDEIIIKNAQAAGLRREPEYRQTVKRFQDDMTLQLYQKDKINVKIINSEDSLRAYYEKRKNSRYMAPARAEVRVIFLNDSLKARQVLKEALRGENFDLLYRNFNTRTQPSKGYLGFITSDDYGAIGKAALTSRPNRIYPEIVPSGHDYAVVRILRFKDAQPLDYSSIKPRVATDYGEEQFQALRQKLMNELKKKYHLTVYFDNLFKSSKRDEVSN